MKTAVLDSWAILEWILHDRPSARYVSALLAEAERGESQLWLSFINAGEVYYFLAKHHGAELAASWRDTSHTLPVSLDLPRAPDIWLAAEIKARFPLSYADAFAAQLAMKHEAPLVTGDPEFRQVPGLELDWIER